MARLQQAQACVFGVALRIIYIISISFRMIHNLGVDIIRNLLDDKERELNDLFRLKRWERTKDFCWTVRGESVLICRTDRAQIPGAC